MKILWLLLSLCLWVIPLRATSNAEEHVCKSLITKWTLWDGILQGFASKLKIPVASDITSWTVEFQFNKKFAKLNFFNSAKSKDKEGSKFSVVNEEWSGKKKKGDFIKFAMLGDYERGNDEPIRIMYISLNGVVLCGEREGNVLS